MKGPMGFQKTEASNKLVRDVVGVPPGRIGPRKQSEEDFEYAFGSFPTGSIYVLSDASHYALRVTLEGRPMTIFFASVEDRDHFGEHFPDAPVAEDKKGDDD